MKELIIDKLGDNQRLDKYLSKYLSAASKSFIYKMLRKKNITLNDKKADGSEKLQSGDSVKIFFSDETLDKFSEGKSCISNAGSRQTNNMTDKAADNTANEPAVKTDGKYTDSTADKYSYTASKKGLSVDYEKIYRPLDIVYEDENGFRNKRSINDMIHSYQVGSYTGSNHNDDLEEELYKTAGSDASADESRGLTEKTKKQQADALKEEEKYDHLLNSIQAQTLIRTVDKVNLGGAVNNTQDNLEEVDTAGFTGSEVGSFVKSQCDIMEEASRYIENAKVEYDSVTDYYEDIQRIENAPENIKLKLMYAADRVDNLSVDRRIFKSPENKLSNKVYRMMESYEEDFPEALVKLRHDEEDYNTVLKNVRMIKGERSMYRIEANDLVKKQLRIKKYSVLMLALLVGVFVIFLLISAASPDDEHIGMFITVVILALTLSLGLFAYLKSTERKVYVTEVKLNKATALLNKYKIKYVNAVNVLEYEYSKYAVKSAFELEQKFQAYVEMKDEQRKILEITSNLNEAEAELTDILRQLGVIDTHIWIGQVKAILNPKEMVEVRHNLSIRRQKLREQIEYNESRIEDARNNIKNVTKKNKVHAKEVMQVLEIYEKRHKNN